MKAIAPFLRLPNPSELENTNPNFHATFQTQDIFVLQARLKLILGIVLSEELAPLQVQIDNQVKFKPNLI
jgi:hypothetical protein